MSGFLYLSKYFKLLRNIKDYKQHPSHSLIYLNWSNLTVVFKYTNTLLNYIVRYNRQIHERSNYDHSKLLQPYDSVLPPPHAMPQAFCFICSSQKDHEIFSHFWVCTFYLSVLFALSPLHTQSFFLTFWKIFSEGRNVTKNPPHLPKIDLKLLTLGEPPSTEKLENGGHSRSLPFHPFQSPSFLPLCTTSILWSSCRSFSF